MNSLALIPALPLLGFLVNGLLGRRLPAAAVSVVGCALPATPRATDETKGRSFAGELIVAPLSARGTVWMRRFGDHSSAFASGWMGVVVAAT